MKILHEPVTVSADDLTSHWETREVFSVSQDILIGKPPLSRFSVIRVCMAGMKEPSEFPQKVR